MASSTLRDTAPDRQEEITVKKMSAVLMTLVLLFVCMASSGFASQDVPAEKITLNRREAVVAVGKTLKLKAAVSPKNATVKTVQWLSSDAAVATVTRGTVTGIAPGKATITAKADDGSGVEASLEVTVVLPVKSIEAERTSVELVPGEAYAQKIHMEPDNAGVNLIRWKSSSGKVAEVDEKGIIYAVGKGKCTITGTAADGSGKKVTVKVKVLDKPAIKPENNGKDIEAGTSADVAVDPGMEEEEDFRAAAILPWDPEENLADIKDCSWITPPEQMEACPVFRRTFGTEKPVERAELQITSLGVYEAELNGRRVGDFYMAPGWTSYGQRLQVQKYDVTSLLENSNELRVTVGNGWFRSREISGKGKKRLQEQPCSLIALLILRYTDGSEERIATDESWEVGGSPILFSEIYDGETCDARVETADWKQAAILDWSREILIPQEGEIVRETERVSARRVFRTPSGEVVVDFGQEVTGYVEFTVNAEEGALVCFDHGEMLDKKGEFYNENYRSAKAEVRYTCREGRQTWHPRLAFFGFRYIRLKDWPGTPQPEQFTAVAVHSDMRRTGWIETGSGMLNQLLSNIVWSQRGNFLDIPSDCPQRNERFGWTGDAQVFIKAASYLYDTELFYRKWLRDMAADQRADGGIPHVVPDALHHDYTSAAWGDAAAICPWQLFQTYGDSSVLEEQFSCMKGWVDYITKSTKTPNLWTGGRHFGDWLGLDAGSGSYVGATRMDFIASAFYAHSTELLVKTGKLLGRDVSEYEALHGRIVSEFRRTYPEYKTQTEYALAIYFGLAEDPQEAADRLAKMIRSDGGQIRTGFVGTPYILHVLSNYGHADLAWDLLLREEYPGWLYPVTKGATTMWEHWNGIREDGSFWSPDMNSFNHYAYGSVADWLFEQAAGISHDEDHPGFSELIWQPHPDQRVSWLSATLNTRNGTVKVSWRYEDGRIRYELDTPVPTQVLLPEKTIRVMPGTYTFWGRQ